MLIPRPGILKRFPEGSNHLRYRDHRHVQSGQSETWRVDGLPDLAVDGYLVGINLTGPRLADWDSRLQRCSIAWITHCGKALIRMITGQVPANLDAFARPLVGKSARRRTCRPYGA
jgi:hypothetical protein